MLYCQEREDYVPDNAPEKGISAVWHNSTCERSWCACDHTFTLKRKTLLTADTQKELVKHRRAMESVEETLQWQEQARTHRASMRAFETQEQYALGMRVEEPFNVNIK